MQIFVLNTKYERIGLIDEYEEMLWQKKYNDVGECQIKIPCEDIYIGLLAEGNYLFRYDDDMFCKIETVNLETDIESGDYLIVTAIDMCNILAGRIVRWQFDYSGTVAGYIQKLLTDNVINPKQAMRKIDNFAFEIDTSNGATFTETISVITEPQDLLQLILTTCKTFNYGFRVLFDIGSGRVVFRLYRGKNKAQTTSENYVEFSPSFANMLTSTYTTDSSNHKNIVYVSYKGDDEQVYLTSIHEEASEPSGENRREIFVDGTNTSRDVTLDTLQSIFSGNVKRNPATQGTETSGYYYVVNAGETVKVATFEVTTSDEKTEEKITVTDYTYMKLITAIGTSTLAEHKQTQEFTGEVDTIGSYEYKQDYDLGDVVKVINRYGIEAEAQITEVMESDDLDNGHVFEPVFEYLGG